ncbi:hypothetical protein ACFL3D_05570 [Candidatus Omnitrophota bacterium]
MNKALMVFGLIICIVEVIFFVKHELMDGMIAYFIQGNRLYISAGVKGILGIILLVAAGTANVPAIFIALGILTLCGVSTAFIMPREKLVAIMNWFATRSVKFKKGIAIYGFIIGLLLVIGA